MAKQKIESIDFIRALSVLFIIIFHFSAVILYDKKMDVNISRYIFPLFGGLGVSFFIIISGGGIYNSVKSSFDFKVFYKKRILSIFPSYYIAYIVTALMLFLFTGRVIFQGDFSNVIWTVLGVDGYLSQRVKTYYLIGEWFVGFIILMYILFPLIRYVYCKNSFFTLAGAIAISLISIHYNSVLYEYLPFWNKRDIWNPLVRLPEFIIGMILFEAIANERYNIIKFLLILSVTILSGYAIHDHRDMVVNEFRNIPVFISMLVVLVVTYEYLLKVVHANNLILFLSKYSFLAFLYHHQVLSIISLKINLQGLDKTGIIFCGITAIFISFILAYFTFDIVSRFKIYLDNKIPGF